MYISILWMFDFNSWCLWKYVAKIMAMKQREWKVHNRVSNKHSRNHVKWTEAHYIRLWPKIITRAWSTLSLSPFPFLSISLFIFFYLHIDKRHRQPFSTKNTCLFIMTLCFVCFSLMLLFSFLTIVFCLLCGLFFARALIQMHHHSGLFDYDFVFFSRHCNFSPLVHKNFNAFGGFVHFSVLSRTVAFSIPHWSV